MRRLIGAAAAVVGLALIAGCGSYSEANGFNIPDSQMHNLRPHWTRIDSPANYPTITRACVGSDGVYITQDATASVEVVANDPECR